MSRVGFLNTTLGRVLLGLALGVATGLFLGDLAASLDVFGRAYIALLQMTVLPYVLTTLIGGIGRLDPSGAGRLGLYAIGLIVFLWALTWLTVLAIPLAYPHWDTGSFYSSSLTAEPAQFDFVAQFIPANVFRALSDTAVPAVVVFAIAVGLAVMALPEKGSLLSGLKVLDAALGRIASFVVTLAPLGIFAIAADATGTLRLDELGKLQIYLGTYVAAWALLGFITLPLLIGVATPLSYWRVMRRALTPMVTAFAANTVLVVLPLIAEESKKLLDESKLSCEGRNCIVDVLAPTAFTLPTAGTPISVAFILFAAWFAGQPLAADQYPSFTFLGFMSSFGGMYLALPYMLDFFQVPSDLFQLFVVGTVATSQLWSALAAMHGIAICLLGACALAGRLSWIALFVVASASLVLSAAFFWLLSFAFSGVLPEENVGEQRLLSMRLVQDTVAMSQPKQTEPLSPADLARDRLAVIHERGSLRVGYHKDRLPFVYKNGRGELVGLDMELLHGLAKDLGVTLEMVKVPWLSTAEWLDDGRLDLAVGGITITPERAQRVAFTRSYVEDTPAFLVPDHRRRSFADLATIRALPKLRIAVTPGFFEREVAVFFPNAELVVVETPQQYLRGEMPDVDALLSSAEVGSAWTLIYPEFDVVAPRGLGSQVPNGFAASRANPAFLIFLDNWMEVSLKLGTVEQLYNHWILGDPPGPPAPRWSIIRDVLGWVD